MRNLILAFLLATCGSASAQLVLQICTPQIPCPGFPLGSVQAGVDQNGWRNFKVTLTQNVTLFSIVGTPPPSQASVNVIFTQDGIGGRTVTFASNITNPCIITGTANATTLCQFEFDGIAGIWFGIAGGGLASLPTAAAGSVFASQGIGFTSALQTKTAVDVRDTVVANGFDCTGTNAMDTGMQSISATAHVIVPFGCIVKLNSAHTYPQTFEFKQGAQLAPTTGTLITLTGSIIAGSYQIFSNALATQGGISFQGNSNSFNVLPEWWGAGTAASAATNTTAIQASIYGAFGCNVSPATTCRINGSGLNQYNKPLFLCGNYSISGELHWYHVINFVVVGCGRLTSGITQSGTNVRIFDGQSDAYGSFRDITFSASASQDLAHPLIDLNFDGSQGADIKPQFIDFYNVGFFGSGLAKTGVRIAAAGGSAQGSNINFFNPAASGFTEAAYMIGSGSGCVPTNNATNAIQISWYGGDMQNNHAYGVENFGGGNLLWDGGSAENGGNIALGAVQQTGADFCANNINAGNGGFTIKHMRSESPYLLAPIGGAGNSGGWNLIDVISVDDISFHNGGAGTSLGDLYEGESSCGHGFWYKVTTAGTLSGLGARIAPLTASGGSATTIVDGTGGFTVNAWTGFYVCFLSSGQPQYCLITSNTANTFTCTAGWQTDYPAIPIVNPSNGTTYDIQPAWGGATVTSGTTTLTRDDTTYSGISLAINVFFPGKRVSASIGSVVDNLEMTRSDWAQGGTFPEAPVESAEGSVLVGSPQVTTAGTAGISQNPYYVRTWTLLRNGVTEVPFLVRKDYGTRVLHWFNGQTAGGVTVADAYIGVDPAVPSLSSPAGQGDFFIINNSNNTAKKWTFNFDGSATFPSANLVPSVSWGGAALSTDGNGGLIKTTTLTNQSGLNEIYLGTGAATALFFGGVNSAAATSSLFAAGTVSSGTTFTASGCGNTTLVGGASAGKYTSVTAGACTVTVTMGNGLTSNTGWTCDAHDLTTVADANNVTMGTSTTTTANLVEGTVAANDVIAFKCTGY